MKLSTSDHLFIIQPFLFLLSSSFNQTPRLTSCPHGPRTSQPFHTRSPEHRVLKAQLRASGFSLHLTSG